MRTLYRNPHHYFVRLLLMGFSIVCVGALTITALTAFFASLEHPGLSTVFFLALVALGGWVLS